MIEEDNMHDDGDVYMGEYNHPFAINILKWAHKMWLQRGNSLIVL